MKLTTIITAAIVALAAPATASTYVVPDDHAGGGNPGWYANHISNLDSKGASIEIRQPMCMSSCTLYLTAKDVCVEADTILGFHGPSNWAVALTGINALNTGNAKRQEQIRNWGYLYAKASRQLADWFVKSAGQNAGAFTANVKGQAAHDAWGIELCEEK